LKPPSIPDNPDIPSGKHTKNYGKSPFFMGKSTISMAMFNSYVKLPEGIYTINGNPLMVDISIVNGIINQLITWGAPPCRSNMVHTWYPHPRGRVVKRALVAPQLRGAASLSDQPHRARHGPVAISTPWGFSTGI